MPKDTAEHASPLSSPLRRLIRTSPSPSRTPTPLCDNALNRVLSGQEDEQRFIPTISPSGARHALRVSIFNHLQPFFGGRSPVLERHLAQLTVTTVFVPSPSPAPIHDPSMVDAFSCAHHGLQLLTLSHPLDRLRTNSFRLHLLPPPPPAAPAVSTAGRKAPKEFSSPKSSRRVSLFSASCNARYRTEKMARYLNWNRQNEND